MKHVAVAGSRQASLFSVVHITAVTLSSEPAPRVSLHPQHILLPNYENQSSPSSSTFSGGLPHSRRRLGARLPLVHTLRLKKRCSSRIGASHTPNLAGSASEREESRPGIGGEKRRELAPSTGLVVARHIPALAARPTYVPRHTTSCTDQCGDQSDGCGGGRKTRESNVLLCQLVSQLQNPTGQGPGGRAPQQ